jgi:hypothetical protein
MAQNNEILQILSLPPLNGQALNRYPRHYTDINGNEGMEIKIPVGCLSCRSSCYTDITDVVNDGEKCRRCSRSIKSADRFIDVGLLNLMTKYHSEIEATKPYYIEYDGMTSDIRFIKQKEGFEGRLAEIATEHIVSEISNKLQDKNELNYPSIKGVFSNRIDTAIGEFKPELITWCRGRLHLDENFSALNLNFSSSPHKVLCFQLLDLHGKPLTLDYKNTHIHYLPKWRIFILLVIEGQTPDRRLGIRVIDLNKMSLGNQKLIVVSTGSYIEGRVWYATSVDYKNYILYVVGGLDNSGYTSNKVVSLKINDWIPQ